jgi:hypothetical protein
MKQRVFTQPGSEADILVLKRDVRFTRLPEPLIGMPLTDEQRAELEALGPETVRAKLIQAGPGRGASLAGLRFSRRLTCSERGSQVQILPLRPLLNDPRQLGRDICHGLAASQLKLMGRIVRPVASR